MHSLSLCIQSVYAFTQLHSLSVCIHSVAFTQSMHSLSCIHSVYAFTQSHYLLISQGIHSVAFTQTNQRVVTTYCGIRQSASGCPMKVL